MRVVVGASSFADANDAPLKLLEDIGMEVIKNPFGRRLTESEIIAHLAGAEGLLAGLEPLNENVFSHAQDLKAIARIGIGMDNVDREAAARYGIKVSNTPDGPTEAVAEMTLAALLSLIHNINQSDQDIHGREWKKRLGKSISGLKVFIIGYGHIGKRTAALLQSVGALVKVYDKYIGKYPDDGISHVDKLEDGLTWADAISLHVSGKEEVIDTDEISLMQNGVFLLNSARGALINEDALYEALNNGKIAGFWADAFWQEPYKGKICDCSNALLTPHTSTYTKTCRESMEAEAVKNLIRDLGVDTVVNENA